MRVKQLVLEAPKSNLSWLESEMPKPGAGQVRIKVVAAAINPVDWKLSKSAAHPAGYPVTPLVDVAGIVDEVHDPRSRHLIGRRVAVHGSIECKFGGASQYSIQEIEALGAVPDGLALEVAASVPCPMLTAFQAFKRMNLKDNDTLLVNGASGAVGYALVQLALSAGIDVLAASSGRKSSEELLPGLGLPKDQMVVSDAQDPERIVREVLAKRPGVKALLDARGDTSSDLQIERLLDFSGSVACLGGFPPLAGGLAFRKAPSVHQLSLGGAYLTKDKGALAEMGSDLTQLLESVARKQLMPLPVANVIFEELPGVFEELKAGKRFGKHVVVIDPELARS